MSLQAKLSNTADSDPSNPDSQISRSNRPTMYDSGCDAVSDLLLGAILRGDIPEIEDLVNGGARIAPVHQWVVYYGCLQGCSMVRALATAVDLNRPVSAEEDETVLHALLRTPASHFVDPKDETIASLLNLGASAVAVDRLGDTPLHTIAGGDGAMLASSSVMQVLLGNNMNGVPFITNLGDVINMKNRDPFGTTPLIIATIFNNVTCVRLLLQHGANPDECGEVVNGCRRPALYFAAARNYLDIFEVLLQFGGAVDPGTGELLSPAMIHIVEKVDRERREDIQMSF